MSESPITWGCCRESDGSVTHTVFCIRCKSVFGRGLGINDARDLADTERTKNDCNGGLCSAALAINGI